MPDLITAFGLIATVLILSALTSGLVERGPLSFPMIFLGLGFLIGERGLNLIAVEAEDPTLEVVAILTLSLVLFLDALNLRFEEFGNEWILPVLALGPGTVLTVAVVAGAAVLLFDFSWTLALLIGAILASTDPVVLREVVRDSRVPGSVRRTLTAEAGTNDLVVLPAVLILIAVARSETAGVAGWIEFAARLLIVGPAVGALIGASGAWAMAQVDRRHGIRTAYQAMFGIGLVLAAYAAADAVGGDGFLAAFAAGFAVSFFNLELCGCFLEYGETSAEMTMLLAFVLFGAVLSTLVGTIALGPALLFAAIVIFVARPLAMVAALSRARVSWIARLFVAWFGPRGLNSLLLALLVIHGGLAQGQEILAIVGVVVIASVVLHGCSATPLAAWYGRKLATEVLEEERGSTAADIFMDEGGDAPRISVERLHEMLASGEPPIVLDVRTRSQFARADGSIPGSVRTPPDEVITWLREQDLKRAVVAYCT